ncbi:Uncharacterised protein [Mycobacteroides abscessus subsp. abscessus]|nr:Uncharacterised protein [Mycobacteroides abscessus subsp. abscessus]
MKARSRAPFIRSASLSRSKLTPDSRAASPPACTALSRTSEAFLRSRTLMRTELVAL